MSLLSLCWPSVGAPSSSQAALLSSDTTFLSPQLILLSSVMEPVKTVTEGLRSEKDLGMNTDQAWKIPTMAFPAQTWAPTTTTWSQSMETLTWLSLGENWAVSFVAALSTMAPGGPHPATCPANPVSTGRHKEMLSHPAHVHPSWDAPGLQQTLSLAILLDALSFPSPTRTISPRARCPLCGQRSGFPTLTHPCRPPGLYEGFEGLQAEECGILNGCENGRCVRVPEGYTCDCFDGYQLDMTLMACVGKWLFVPLQTRWPRLPLSAAALWWCCLGQLSEAPLLSWVLCGLGAGNVVSGHLGASGNSWSLPSLCSTPVH